MLLQVARQLIKRVHAVRQNNAKLAQIEGYLSGKSAGKSRFQGLETDPRHLIEDFEHVARQQVSWSFLLVFLWIS